MYRIFKDRRRSVERRCIRRISVCTCVKKLFKKRVLFAAGHGNTFDKLSLEDQVYNYHRQHCQQASRHQDREVG